MSGIAAGAALLVAPPPLAAPAIGWRTTVERMSEDKFLAEGCISILKNSEGDHPMIRVQGAPALRPSQSGCRV